MNNELVDLLKIFMLSIFILIIFNIINEFIIKPICIDRQKFKLYKTRDKLVLLAMKDNISTSSKEYRFLSLIINSEIKYLEKKIDMFSFYKAIIEPSVDKNKYESLIKNITKNNELQPIFKNYIEIVYKKNRFKILKYHLMLSFISFILFLIFDKPKKKHAITNMQKNLKTYESQIKYACV